MPKFRYVTIFKTSIVQAPPCKYNEKPTITEFTREEQSFFTYNRLENKVLTLNTQSETRLRNIIFPELDSAEMYIVISTEISAESPVGIKNEVQARVYEKIAQMSTTYGPELFENGPIYMGWVDRYGKCLTENFIKISNPITELLPLKTIQPDTYPLSDEKKQLIHKFFCQSIFLDPSEIRFVLNFTVFEIFPMENRTDITPILKFIAVITNKSSHEVKTSLAIGRIHNERSNLLHHGQFKFINENNIGIMCGLMTDLTITILRQLNGLPYNQILDKYFNSNLVSSIFIKHSS